MKVVCLILIGFFVSSYLLMRSFALSGSSAGPGTDVCSAVFGSSCDDTLRSPLAHQLGIPLAGWGMVYYGTLATLLALGWSLGSAFQFESTLTMLILSLLGAVLSLMLAATMLIGIAAFCPLCGVVQVTNLLLVPVLWRLTRRRPGE